MRFLNWETPNAPRSSAINAIPQSDSVGMEVAGTETPTAFTVWTKTGEVLEVLLASPMYTAVIECVP